MKGIEILRNPTLKQKRSIEGFLFVLPWIISFLMFVGWPIFFSLFLSFTKVNPVKFQTRFVGLRNYTRAFVLDMDFVPIMLNTIRNVALNTPVIIVFSLSMALLLNRKLPGQTIMRAIFFLPVVISSGYVINELLGQGVGGLSMVLGVENIAQGTSSTGQTFEVVQTETTNFINISRILNEFVGPEFATGINEILNKLGLTMWRSGIQILLFLAGLQGISYSFYEAGKIDGANEWTLFWKVTLPMISPILYVVIIFTIVDSFTDVFNDILHYVHAIAFTDHNFGYSSAISWMYFIVIFAMIMLVSLFIRKRIFYRGEK
jgi:ABC-type sugar transport system permease subunit